MSRENLLSLFREFQRFHNNVAVVQSNGYRREAWRYGELIRSAITCAVLLKERGVQTGDRVLLWAPNSAEWMAAFWGCLLRGAVVVPMDDGASSDFASRVARDAAVRLVVASQEKMRAAGSIFDDLPVVEVDNFSKVLWKANNRDLNERDNSGQGAINCQALSDEPLTRKHVAQILFTSGTTSEPRGVVLTHGNFLANLEPLETGMAAYCRYERWFHPLRMVSLVPLSHVFGQFMALFVPPLLGMTIVFELSASYPEIVRSVKRERATALIAVPGMLEAIRTGIERDLAEQGRSEWFKNAFGAAGGKKFLRRSWTFRTIHRRLGWKFWAFISGGAALTPATEDFFKRLGYAVVQGYGMTETASLISLNHPFHAAAGTIGKVLPGREFRLAEDGEILVRGENVSAGYWEAGALRPASEEGWLHTGDIGELDGEGNLRFRGRKKNVMVTAAGLNIYPEDLEAALRKQSEIRDCVVVPIESAGNAEPCAVLLINSTEAAVATSSEARKRDRVESVSEENAANAAIAGANSLLAEYQCIRVWVVWPETDFPRTSTGKPRLVAISEYADRSLRGARAGGETSSSSNPSLNQLLRSFAAHSNAGSMSPDEIERGLNVSSLDRVELMTALEQTFHVELNEAEFSQAESVADIQRLLKRPSARRTEYSYLPWAQSAVIRGLRIAVYYTLVWPATLLLAHPKVIGRENLKTENDPVLFISNHVTRRSDIGLILAALPPRYRHNLATAMGGETLQALRHPARECFFAKRWAYQLGYWLVTALFNVFPLPQRSGFRESFRFAGESADRGYSILVFPEGEVTRDGKVAAFQSGIGLLAEKLGLPIVPMRLDGAWEMKREKRRLARRGEITVRIGAPVKFPSGTNLGNIARALEALVRSL